MNESYISNEFRRIYTLIKDYSIEYIVDFLDSSNATIRFVNGNRYYRPIRITTLQLGNMASSDVRMVNKSTYYKIILNWMNYYYLNFNRFSFEEQMTHPSYIEWKWHMKCVNISAGILNVRNSKHNNALQPLDSFAIFQCATAIPLSIHN